MKKLISLAVLTALVSACADTKNTNGMYGGEFGEESLVEESCTSLSGIQHYQARRHGKDSHQYT